MLDYLTTVDEKLETIIKTLRELIDVVSRQPAPMPVTPPPITIQPVPAEVPKYIDVGNRPVRIRHIATMTVDAGEATEIKLYPDITMLTPMGTDIGIKLHKDSPDSFPVKDGAILMIRVAATQPIYVEPTSTGKIAIMILEYD